MIEYTVYSSMVEEIDIFAALYELRMSLKKKIQIRYRFCVKYTKPISVYIQDKRKDIIIE